MSATGTATRQIAVAPTADSANPTDSKLQVKDTSRKEVQISGVEKSLYQELLGESGFELSDRQALDSDEIFSTNNFTIMDKANGLTFSYQVTLYRDRGSNRLYLVDQNNRRIDLPRQIATATQATTVLQKAVGDGLILLDYLGNQQTHDVITASIGPLLRVRQLNSSTDGEHAFAYLVNLRLDSEKKGKPSPELLFGDPKTLLEDFAKDAGIKSGITEGALAGFTRQQQQISGALKEEYKNLLDGSGMVLNTEKYDETPEEVSAETISLYDKESDTEHTYVVKIHTVKEFPAAGVPLLGKIYREKHFIIDDYGQRIDVTGNDPLKLQTGRGVAVSRITEGLKNGVLKIAPQSVAQVTEKRDTLLGTFNVPTRLETRADGARYMNFLLKQRKAALENNTFTNALVFGNVKELLPEGASEAALEGARSVRASWQWSAGIAAVNTVMDLVDPKNFKRPSAELNLLSNRIALVGKNNDGHAALRNRNIARLDKVVNSDIAARGSNKPAPPDRPITEKPSSRSIDGTTTNSAERTSETAKSPRPPTGGNDIRQTLKTDQVTEAQLNRQLEIAEAMNARVIAVNPYTGSLTTVRTIGKHPDGSDKIALVTISKDADVAKLQLDVTGQRTTDKTTDINEIFRLTEGYKRSGAEDARLRRLAESGEILNMVSGRSGPENRFTERIETVDGIDLLVTPQQRANVGNRPVIGRDPQGNVYAVAQDGEHLIRISADGNLSSVLPARYDDAVKGILDGRLLQVFEATSQAANSIIANPALTTTQKVDLLAKLMPGTDVSILNALLADPANANIRSIQELLQTYIANSGQIPDLLVVDDQVAINYKPVQNGEDKTPGSSTPSENPLTNIVSDFERSFGGLNRPQEQIDKLEASYQAWKLVNNADDVSRLEFARQMAEAVTTGSETADPANSAVANRIISRIDRTFGKLDRPAEEIGKLEHRYDIYKKGQAENDFIEDRTVLSRSEWIARVEKRRRERDGGKSLVDYAAILEPAPEEGSPYVFDSDAEERVIARTLGYQTDANGNPIGMPKVPIDELRAHWLVRRNKAILRDTILDPKYGPSPLGRDGEIKNDNGDVMLKWNTTHQRLEVDSNFIISGYGGDKQLALSVDSIRMATQSIKYKPTEVVIKISDKRPPDDQFIQKDGRASDTRVIVPGVLHQSWELTPREIKFIEANPDMFYKDGAKDFSKIEPWLAYRRNWGAWIGYGLVEDNLPISFITSSLIYSQQSTSKAPRSPGGSTVSAAGLEGANLISLIPDLDVRTINEMNKWNFLRRGFDPPASGYREDMANAVRDNFSNRRSQFLAGLYVAGFAITATLFIRNLASKEDDKARIASVDAANTKIYDAAKEAGIDLATIDRIMLDPSRNIFLYLEPVKPGTSVKFADLVGSTIGTKRVVLDSYNIDIDKLIERAEQLDKEDTIKPGTGYVIDIFSDEPGKQSSASSVKDRNTETLALATNLKVNLNTLDWIVLDESTGVVLLLEPVQAGSGGKQPTFEELVTRALNDPDKSYVMDGKEVIVKGRGALIREYLSKNEINNLLNEARKLDAANTRPGTRQRIKP